MSWAEIKQTCHEQCASTITLLETTERDAPALVRSSVESAFSGGTLSVLSVAESIGGPVAVAVRAAGDAAWHLLPGWVKDRLVDFVASPITLFVVESCGTLKGSVEEVDGKVADMGIPERLRYFADKLQEDVSAPAGALYDEMSAPLKAEASWDMGRKSDLYCGMNEDQKAQVQQGIDYVTTLKDILRSHADALEAYGWAVVGVVGGLVATILGLVVAVAAAETVIGIIVGILAAVAGLVVAVVSAIQVFTASDREIHTRVVTAREAMAHNWSPGPMPLDG